MRPRLRTRQTVDAKSIIVQIANVSAVKALRAVWIVAIVWYELGVFFWSVAQCAWPDRAFEYRETRVEEKGMTSPVHVLLVADPQVLDMNSYPERGRFLSFVSQIIVDLNMRKSWRAVRHLLLSQNRKNSDEDTIVFLGDMMDNGRNAYGDEEYSRYYTRFKSIFSLNDHTKAYYIPGNHDVGLGASHAFSPHSRARYIKHFDPLNYKVSLANHTLVMIDAPGLVEEDYRRAAAGRSFEDWTPASGGVVDFVNKFASVGTEESVVLLTHIPLFRPDTASCGTLREKGSIRRGAGFGYQNTLGRQTSQYLLKNLRPVAIFSGDDHDYCEYTHSIPLLSEGPEPKIECAREVTVKSFSMAMGVHVPGFQLLSLADPGSIMPGKPSFADAPCLLPDQIAIYVIRYVPLLAVTICVLAISTFRRLHEPRSRGGTYNLDIDPSDGSSIQMSPESSFGGQISARTRIPNSALSGVAGASTPPTYRAYTPNSVASKMTPGGHVATPGLLSAPPAGLSAVLGDAERGYFSHTHTYGHGHGHDELDEDDESQYAELRMPDGAFYAPTMDRTPGRRRRRYAWSGTFVLLGRRRRVTVGVPPFLEQGLLRLLSFCRWGGRVNSRGTRKGGRSVEGVNRGHGGRVVFLDDLVRLACLPALLFVLINLYMFR